MPPQPNNEFYQLQDANNRLMDARRNAAAGAGARLSAQNAGGIETQAGWDAYQRERDSNRRTTPPSNTGYKTNPDGTPRFYTQDEINSLPMGAERDMARIERGRMTIPDMENELQQNQPAPHVTPELKPNPANQNKPIRATAYDRLPEHMQHNFRQIYGDNFADIYNSSDNRFQQGLHGLTSDYGARNAAEILMNPSHPKNFLKAYHNKPGADGKPEALPAWLEQFHQNGVAKKAPTDLKAPQFADGRISGAPQQQVAAAGPGDNSKMGGTDISPQSEEFLNGLQARFDARMKAHDDAARARGVNPEQVRQESQALGALEKAGKANPLPPKPAPEPELSPAQQQMAQSLKAAQRRITGADDFETGPDGLTLVPKPKPKPEKLKNDFGFDKFKKTNPAPAPLDLKVNTTPEMPKPPGMPTGSLASKLASMKPQVAKPFAPPQAPIFPQGTLIRPPQEPKGEAPSARGEAPKPVQVKPLNSGTPKRPGILGGLRRKR